MKSSSSYGELEVVAEQHAVIIYLENASLEREREKFSLFAPLVFEYKRCNLLRL